MYMLVFASLSLCYNCYDLYIDLCDEFEDVVDDGTCEKTQEYCEVFVNSHYSQYGATCEGYCHQYSRACMFAWDDLEATVKK